MSRSIKKQADEILAETVAELLAGGMSMAEISRNIGKSRNAIYRLFDQYPDLLKRHQENRRKCAAMELQKNLDAMVKVRDEAENPLAKVRAAQAIEQMAGVSYARTPGGISIQIFGESVSVGEGGMSGADLRALAEEFGKKIGLDQKVIEAEFSLDSARIGGTQDAPTDIRKVDNPESGGAGP